MRIFAVSGTVKPQISAILGARWPTIFDGAAHFILLFVVEDIAAALYELFLNGVVNRVLGDDRLFGRADEAVIERFGVNDGVDGDLNVCRLVDDGGGVARADAERRFARAVRAAHHAGAARGEDDVRRLHERVRHFEGGNVDPADDALGRARLDSCVKHDFRRGDRALLCPRVRRDDQRVAGLERDQRLVDRGRSRVGRRDDRGDDADRLGDLLDAETLVVLEHTASLDVLVRVVDVLGSIVVLDHLVLDHAHAGFGYGHLGQRNAGIVRGKRGGGENPVHLLLRIFGVLDLRRLDPGDQPVQHFAVALILRLFHLDGRFGLDLFCAHHQSSLI